MSGESHRGGCGPQVDTVHNSIGMRLVRIPAGEFVMGSPATRRLPGFPHVPPTPPSHDEYPPHCVHITKPFLIGATSVTQGQWMKVLSERWHHPWAEDGYLEENVVEGDDVAADYISWEHAVAFCAALTRLEHGNGSLPSRRQYRLPTEAEWEYACRAGSDTAFAYGESDECLGEYAWYLKNAYYKGETYAHEVGMKRPNAWGLYDMHGNVEEWCSDWYAKDFYAESPSSDPTGPATGTCRVLRGGSWQSASFFCRSASRSLFLPDETPDFGVGVRVVCDLVDP